jgi:DNA-directed RNA polymerase subunit RPC12/RpoP
MARKMDKNKSFVIDLSKIEGSGEFQCPECGATISPDDRSDDAYTILKPVVKEDRLEKLIIQCNVCGSKIGLVGFHLLGKPD